jgi:hypothetical protein
VQPVPHRARSARIQARCFAFTFIGTGSCNVGRYLLDRRKKLLKKIHLQSDLSGAQVTREANLDQTSRKSLIATKEHESKSQVHQILITV